MTDIFSNPFLIRGLITCIILGVLAPSIGIFLLARRYTVVADALAHFTLVGVALAHMIGISAQVFAPIIAIMASLIMERVRLSKKLFGDAALAVFLTGGLSLALVLSSLSQNSGVNLNAYLFGSLASVRWVDIGIMLCSLVISIVLIKILYPKLFLLTLDEDLAVAMGYKVKMLSLVLIFITASAVASLISSVGALLVGGLMVIPPSAAAQFKLSFKKTLVLGVVLGIVSAIAGFFIAYVFDVPGGATIVLTSLVLLVIAIISND